jgi:hypothetical protein
MAASEAIRFPELAQLRRFSFRQASPFLTSFLSSLWCFASILAMDFSIISRQCSASSEAQ